MNKLNNADTLRMEPIPLWGIPVQISDAIPPGTVKFGDFSLMAAAPSRTGVMEMFQQRIDALLESASKKEVEELTGDERMAVILASGARVEFGENERDGQRYLTFRAEGVGIAKVDGEFIVAQKPGGAP